MAATLEARNQLIDAEVVEDSTEVKKVTQETEGGQTDD
jgi:hypothetical protein